jgi:hypothetical protein
MRVKLEFLSDANEPVERTLVGDNIIRAIDRELKGADWESEGTAWIAAR